MGKIWRPRPPVKAPLEAVGVKDSEEVALEKKRRPRARRPAKAPLKAVGVKDAEGVAVIAIDKEVAASVLEAPVVAAAKGSEKGALEDGPAVCLTAPVVAVTRHEAVGVKDARGVVVGKMWRPRRPEKTSPKAVAAKDAEGVALITVDGKVDALGSGALMVAAVGGREKGPLEDGIIAIGRTDALDRAPVITTTKQESVRVKDARGVVVGKMWRPRRTLKGVRVKDAKGVAVIAIDGDVKASVLGPPVVEAARGGEKGTLEDGTDKGPLEEGIVVCQMDALDGAPVDATTRDEAVGVKNVKGFVVGEMWCPRQPAKAPLEALGVKDTEGVAVITVDGKVEATVLGAPVVVTAGGGEKGPLEEGIVVCLVDTLDGAPVISMTQQEAVGVKNVEGFVVGEMWCPRRPAKVPLEAVGVKDAQVITVMREVKPLVPGVPVVAGSLEDGIVACRMDALNAAPVIATDEKEAASVQEDPVLPAVDQKIDALVVEGMQAITVKGNGKEENDKEGIKWLKHYSTAQSILIIGDGDFSFSLALATAFGSGGNLVATSLDSYEALTIKYGKAESNVRELKRLGVTVLHGVDAETMKLHSYLEMRRFDRIVFNFPHAGFRGREDHLHVIKCVY